jgi:uncharacterized membrane protein
MIKVLTLLHIIGAIVWLGGMFTMLHTVRPAVGEVLQEPPVRLKFMRAATGRFFRIVWVAMPLTLISGIAMVLTVGIKNVPPGVHIMLSLGLLMGAIFCFVWFVPFKKFCAALDAQQFPQAASAHETIRKLVLTNMALGFLSIAFVVLR